MVYARPRIPPTRNGASVSSIDDSADGSAKGYISCLALEDLSDTVPGWVMVFASSYPAAIRAADLVKVEWTPGDGADVSSRISSATAPCRSPSRAAGILLVDDEGLDAALRTASFDART